ncbi:MAG: hypothetical protein ACYTGX_19330 [Planctomycetota bacterium]|jgi:hypothetical protein
MGGALGSSDLPAAAHGWASGAAWFLMMTAFHFQYRDFLKLSALFQQAKAKLEAAAREAAAEEAAAS